MARCSAKVSVMPHEFLARMPIVAVLRGVTPERAADIGRIVFEAGIFAIEVPLNSPQPFDSIARLSAALRGFCLCGAGTVLDPADVRRAYDAGARLIVSPNTNPDVIAAALERSMTVMPGFATATEAFRGIQAGATDLKLFPAASYGPGHLKALKAVLPKSVQVYAVGGVGAIRVAGEAGPRQGQQGLLPRQQDPALVGHRRLADRGQYLRRADHRHVRLRLRHRPGHRLL
jgi:2-dehydro-3-deoxyphosphogalactonate aldolase